MEYIKWTDERLASLKVDAENKVTVIEMAKNHGVTKTRIYQLLTKYNIDTPKKRRTVRKLSVMERTIWRLINTIRSNCKRTGIPFNITIDDFIPVPEYCPVFGTKLDFKEKAKGQRTNNSPSMDRIIPELGYVKGNVVIISWRANRIKNDGTWEEHAKISEFIKTHLEAV